jgi:uncharacterized protein
MVINNINRSRFETEINGDFAYIDYRYHKGDMAVMHTFVPVTERNQGIATQLAKFALEYVKAEKLKLIVYCPTVAKYIRLHPEYESLVDKQHQH